jgi:hypothetical protein
VSSHAEGPGHTDRRCNVRDSILPLHVRTVLLISRVPVTALPATQIPVPTTIRR